MIDLRSAGGPIARDANWRGRMADIRRAATPLGRRVLGRFAIEGTRVHERALRAGIRVEDAVAAPSFLEDPSPRVRELIRRLEQSGCVPVEAPQVAMDALTEGRSIGAICGLVPLPEPPTIHEVLCGREAEAPLLLVGAGVEDPGNVGALARTALASGAAAFVAVGITDPHHPRAVRTSMGSLFKLPLPRYQEVEPLLADLRLAGVSTVGATARDGEPLAGFRPPPGPLAVFVGSEAFGLDDGLAEALERRLTIPMRPDVDSFSVNAAAAIVLYELRRGR